MAFNYTPLDVSRILNEGTSTQLQTDGRKRDGFDKVFFPFSFAILLMALTFYAVKFVSESNTNQNLAQGSVLDTTQVVAALSPEPADSNVVPESVSDIYSEINSIRIDAFKMRQTALVQYPNVNANQLTDIVNRALLEWAALKQFYSDKPESVNPGQLFDTSEPVATFSAVLRDLGVMIADYDARDPNGKPPFTQLVEEFKSNSTIQ